MPTIDPSALAQLFTAARTVNAFTDRPVDDATLHRLYDLVKWGPTSMNAQPARYVFLRSQEAKDRLRPALMAGNVDKTMAAPVVAIIANDTRFFDFMPQNFPAFDAKPMFENDPALAQATAMRNGSMQAGYFILAARSLGLDCGPMSGFDGRKLDAAFFPDGRWTANLLVNLGHGDPSGNHPRGPRLPFETAARIL